MLKQKKIKKKSCFHAYGQVFQKKFFLYHIFIKKKDNSKTCFSMHFDFNN